MKRRRFLSQVAAATVLSAAQSWGEGNSAKAAPIKVGQIGVGHAHATKLSVYRASPDYEVVGIVEPNETLRQQAASQSAFADVPWMTTEQLLNTPGLQAVLVETEVRDLLNVAETCVAAGKHVHLDKPAGSSLPQYRRILESATKQNLMVQMGYMYRYNPGVVMLHEFLKQGWLGEVFEVHTVMSKVVPPSARRQLAEYPGGIMFELGCHIMDLVIGVLGAPEKVDSYARHSGKEDDNLLDNMLAVLSYPNAIASVKSAALEVEGFGRRHLTVCGSKGTFHIQPLDNPSVRISLDEAHGEYKRGTQDIALPKYSRYVGDAADMAQIIRGEKENSFSVEHDLTVQDTLLKACGLPLDG
ncbi:MAG: Gfo/Idh/MocA family oxidoreductase [Planctomycetaceae bacterium]